MFKGMFGRKKRDPWVVGIGDDLPGQGNPQGGANGNGPPGSGNLPQDVMMGQQKPGFLDRGGVGRGIAGTLGDFLLQQADMNPIYAPAMQQEQYLRAQAQRDQAKRFAGLEDYETKKQIDQQYPAAAKPTALERNVDWMSSATEKELEHARNYYDMVTPKLVQNAMGQTVPVRRKTKPRGPLKPVGGAGSNASGGFRR